MTTRKALAFSFLDRYAGLILAILSSMVVARLLTPAEIGVFSVTMVLLSFISALRDMGAGQYLLQEKDLTPERIRATWTVQLALGWTLAIIVFAAAYPVAAFYKEPRMVNIMMVLALNFAISPFGSLTYAWLMREMLFGKLAVMRFASSLAGAITSVALAFYGHGAMSLAIGSIVATVTNAFCATAFRPKSYPWWPGGFSEVARVLKFGSRISATSLVNTMTYASPELALGRLQTMLDVGLFSRANGLTTMFNKLVLDATNSVILSTFARDARAGHSIGPSFLRATAYVTVLGWPFFGIVILFSSPIFQLLYGPQWDAAVPTARLLSIGMAVGLICSLYSNALTAVGRVDLVLSNSIIASFVYAPIMIGAAIFGLDYMGWGFIAASTVIAAIWTLRSSTALQIKIIHLIASVIASAKVTLITLSPAIFIYFFFRTSSYGVLSLVIAIVASLISFFVAAHKLHHPIDDEINKIIKHSQILSKKLLPK